MNPTILLHPNIPKPLHGTAPRTILGDAWWDVQRQLTYKKYNYTCACCGISKKEAKYHSWLEAHEMYDINYVTGKVVFKELVALCHSCHNYIHSGRMQHLLHRGEMSKEKYLDILKHGDKILKEANLSRSPPPNKIAPWEQWRLVIDGKEYKGKFSSYKEWELHYT